MPGCIFCFEHLVQPDTFLYIYKNLLCVDMNAAWGNFFVAVAGAAAALTGLIFVAVSIGLPRILSMPMLSGRASEPLVLLITTLIISVLCLTPEQPAVILGAEIFAIGSICWLLMLKTDIDMLRKADNIYKQHYKRNMVFTQLAVLPYVVAGAIVWQAGFDGIYWLVPGIVCSILKSLLDAWVLLVEIHR